MLIEATHLSKSIGAKDLFHDLNFIIDPGQKVALIGRNGQGKTTILKLLAGEDVDFGGELRRCKNLRVTLTKQEHLANTSESALTYILTSVPHYFSFQKILLDFENGVHSDLHLFSETLERFTSSGYFHIESKILNALQNFQISPELSRQPLFKLSGGEKRYVELVRMMFSKADLYLVDEPTNHMDYLGKAQFISWMQAEPHSILVVTHDRDVLREVSKIIELRDKQLFSFNGNYSRYLEQNTTDTANSVKLYEIQLNKLKEAKKRVEWGLQMRAKSKEWKVRYDHWSKDYEKIKNATQKPSFWIDQNSVENLDRKITDSYAKFKEKNISITIHKDEHRSCELVTINHLSLGYDQPIFSDISFSLRNNDRLFIKGKNGAGKSTLVRTLLSLYRQEPLQATRYGGEIKLGASLRIGEYEQEINPRYLPLTLEEAIHLSYEETGSNIEVRLGKSLLAQYLFDPIIDGRQKISDLSGGQKARFQLIKMLAAKPNLLILDEPTNHLDLPSIEELEKALLHFQGGILYISHDTYFIDHLGGSTLMM